MGKIRTLGDSPERHHPTPRLKNEFHLELQRYHQLDGETNGSLIKGTILSPDTKTEKALRERVDDLVEFLGNQDDLVYKPSPQLGKGRFEFHPETATAASGWVKAGAQTALHAATQLIADPALRAMVHQGLKKCDERFFHEPSSSTGLYHPADEINEGGLALHTARVVAMGEHLADFAKLNPHENRPHPARLREGRKSLGQIRREPR